MRWPPSTRSCCWRYLQRREAWQIVDFVNQLTDPSALADTAGYASYLTQVQKRQLLETPDVASGCAR